MVCFASTVHSTGTLWRCTGTRHLKSCALYSSLFLCFDFSRNPKYENNKKKAKNHFIAILLIVSFLATVLGLVLIV